MNITLHFGGISSGFKVWLNGKFLGYGEDSFLPSEFNITPYLQAGENVVSVQVIRWSDGYFLEDQDQWRMAGRMEMPRSQMPSPQQRQNISGLLTIKKVQNREPKILILPNGNPH